MKLLEAVYLWAIIAVMFFTWAGRHLAADRRGIVLTEREIAQWDGASDDTDAGVVSD